MKKDSHHTILLVDDEPDIREVMSSELQYHGYQVIDADNGHFAFEVLKLNPHVDIVVTDVRMAGGDGIELLENIMKMPGKKPIVIMVTGFADLSEAEALHKGAVALVSKPFKCEDIHKLISKHLQQKA